MSGHVVIGDVADKAGIFLHRKKNIPSRFITLACNIIHILAVFRKIQRRFPLGL